jgi:hypothetical protein
MKMRRLLNEHRTEFDAYKEKHLIEEFKKSLTLISY